MDEQDEFSDDSSFPSLPPEEESFGRKKLMEYLTKHATKRKPQFNLNLFDCDSKPKRVYNFDIEVTKKVKDPAKQQENQEQPQSSNLPSTTSDNANVNKLPPNEQLQSHTISANQKSNENDQPIAVSPKILRLATTPNRRTLDLRRAVIEQNLNRDQQFDSTKNSTFMDNTDAFMKQLPDAASTPHPGTKNIDVAHKNAENTPTQTASIVKPTEFAININVNGNKDDNQPQHQPQQQLVAIPQSPSKGLVHVNYQSPTKTPQKPHQININVTPSRSKMLSSIANNDVVPNQMNPPTTVPSNNHTITLNVVVDQDKVMEKSKHFTPRKIQFSQEDANERNNHQITDDDEKESDEFIEQSPSVVKEKYANIIRQKREAEETFARQSFKLPAQKRRRRGVQQQKTQSQEDYFNAGETIKNYQSHECTRTLYTKGNSLIITDDEDDDHISLKSQPLSRTKSDLTAGANLQKIKFRSSGQGLPTSSTTSEKRIIKPLNNRLSVKEFAKLTQGFRSIAANAEEKSPERNHTCRKSKPMSMSPHSDVNDNDNDDNDNDDQMILKNNDNSLELTSSIDCQFDKLDEASQSFVRVPQMTAQKKSHESGTHGQPRIQLVDVIKKKNALKKMKSQHVIEKEKSKPGPATKKLQTRSEKSLQQSLDSADALDCSEIFVPETQPNETPVKSNTKQLKETRKREIGQLEAQQVKISASQLKRKYAPVQKKQLKLIPATQNSSETSKSIESQDYDIEVFETQPDNVPAASISKPKKYKPGPASTKSKSTSFNKDKSHERSEDKTLNELKTQLKYKPGPASKMQIQKQRKSKPSPYKGNETKNSDNYVSGSDNDASVDDTLYESNVNQEPSSVKQLKNQQKSDQSKRNARTFNEDELQSSDHDSDSNDRTLIESENKNPSSAISKITSQSEILCQTFEFTPMSTLNNQESILIETQNESDQDYESLLEQHDANLSSSVSDLTNRQSSNYESDEQLDLSPDKTRTNLTSRQSSNYESDEQTEHLSQLDFSPDKTLTHNSQINNTKNATTIQRQQQNLSKKMKNCFVKLSHLSHSLNDNDSIHDQSSLISNDISNELFEKSINQTIGSKRAQKRSQSAMSHNLVDSNEVDFSSTEESDYEMELNQEMDDKNIKMTKNRRKRRRKWDFNEYKKDMINRYDPTKARSPPKEGVRRSSRPRGKPHTPFAVSYFYEKGEKPKENIPRKPLQMLKNLPAVNEVRNDSESLPKITAVGNSEIALASDLKFQKENTFEIAFYNLSSQSDGVMRFSAGGKKPLNKARVDMMFMPISGGELTFYVDGNEIKISDIDLVKVYKGSKYSIINQSKQIALIRFSCCGK